MSVQLFQVIMLVRRPRDAFLSQFNSNLTHNITLGANMTTLLGNFDRWMQMVNQSVTAYRRFYGFWTKLKKVKKLVVFYEHLVNNVTKEVERMTRFLGFNVSSEVLRCIEKNSEGHFHRKTSPEQSKLYYLLPRNLKTKLATTHREVSTLLKMIV